MKIENNQSVSLVQKELLARLKQERINQEITQQELASRQACPAWQSLKWNGAKGFALPLFSSI